MTTNPYASDRKVPWTNEQSAAYRSLPCNYCGAKPGEFCRTKGTGQGTVHDMRVAAYEGARIGWERGRQETLADVTQVVAALAIDETTVGVA
jgi:hypothetical protein